MSAIMSRFQVITAHKPGVGPDHSMAPYLYIYLAYNAVNIRMCKLQVISDQLYPMGMRQFQRIFTGGYGGQMIKWQVPGDHLLTWCRLGKCLLLCVHIPKRSAFIHYVI